MDTINIFDFIAAPGTVLGCLTGIAIAYGLYWLFPNKDLVALQALIVLSTTAVGAILEFWIPKKE